MILDLGCGTNKKNNSFGIDFRAYKGVDLVHDLNIFPYPIPDNTFDTVYIDNVIEHLNDVVKVMEEVHRISKSGANIYIYVPYFRSRWASIDPTHTHSFTINSFDYFDPTTKIGAKYNYTSKNFKLMDVKFNSRIKDGFLKSIFKVLFNKKKDFYERNFSIFVPFDELEFQLMNQK